MESPAARPRSHPAGVALLLYVSKVDDRAQELQSHDDCIKALRAADNFDFQPLLAFVCSSRPRDVLEWGRSRISDQRAATLKRVAQHFIDFGAGGVPGAGA